MIGKALSQNLVIFLYLMVKVLHIIFLWNLAVARTKSWMKRAVLGKGTARALIITIPMSDHVFIPEIISNKSTLGNSVPWAEGPAHTKVLIHNLEKVPCVRGTIPDGKANKEFLTKKCAFLEGDITNAFGVKHLLQLLHEPYTVWRKHKCFLEGGHCF